MMPKRQVHALLVLDVQIQPNEINNASTLPGIFRGALEVEATHINEEMKKAAVEAIADLIDSSELNEDYCIPGPLINV